MTSIDLKRILEHEVHVFGLDLSSVWGLVRAFVNQCDVVAETGGDVQIADKNEREVFNRQNPFTYYFGLDRSNEKFEVVLTTLLRRPRTLKHALRRTWIDWQSLHGEVSLNDLLVFNVICTTSTDAIAFMRDHWNELASDTKQQEQSGESSKLTSMWAKQMGAAADDEQRLIWHLVTYLFPSGIIQGRSGNVQGAHIERYWRRISNGCMERGEIRDQRVIRDYMEWKASGGVSTLVSRLTSDALYTSVFGVLFEHQRSAEVSMRSGDLMDLAGVLFSNMLEINGADAHADSAPGFLTLWRLLIKRPSRPTYVGWLLTEIISVLPISMRLQVDLEYFWGGSKHSLLKADEQVKVRGEISKWAKQNVDTAYLCRVLSQDAPHILTHFILGVPRDGKLPKPDWHEWGWIGGIILGALEADPALLVPQVVVLISESQHRFGDWRYDEEEGWDKEPKIETVYDLKKETIMGMYPTLEDRKRFVDAVTDTSVSTDSWTKDVIDMVVQIRSVLTVWQNDDLT